MRLKKYRNSQENRLNLLSLLWLAAKNIQFDHPGQTLSDFYPKGMLGHRDNRKSYADFIKELEKRAGKISSKEPICVSFHTLLGAEDKFRSEIKLLSGRDVNFLKLPGINALRDWQTYNCDAYFMTWQSVFLDPESAITPLRFLASFSDSDFRRFSTLSQKANANITDDKRVGYFDQIADVIFNSATYLPIYQPNHVQFLKKPFQLGSSSYRYQPMVSEVNKSQK